MGSHYLFQYMIAYIKGPITFKSPTSVIIETAGVGYDINISLNTYSELESRSEVQLHTVLLVKEDSHTLYGFFNMEEKQIFQHLISVSGIGPNTARVILSSLKPDEVRNNILSENVAAFNAVKGIGPKTAKRIILDLKDKLTKLGFTSNSSIGAATGSVSTMHEEALGAMMALGFPRPAVLKALKAIAASGEGADVESIIKLALKKLAG